MISTSVQSNNLTQLSRTRARLSSGSSPILPDGISNFEAHFSPVTGITNDSDVAPPVDGESIGAWQDIKASPNPIKLEYTDAIYDSSATPGGYPGATLDGSDDSLVHHGWQPAEDSDNGDVYKKSSGSVVVVVSIGSNDGALWCHGTNASPHHYVVGSAAGTGTNRFTMDFKTRPDATGSTIVLNTVSWTDSNLFSDYSNQYYTIAYGSDDSNYRLRVNSVDQGAPNVITAGADNGDWIDQVPGIYLGTTCFAKACMGIRYQGGVVSKYLAGTITELLIFSRWLTDDEWSGLESHLRLRHNHY